MWWSKAESNTRLAGWDLVVGIAEHRPQRTHPTAKIKRAPKGPILFGERHVYLKNQRAPIVKASTSPANSRLTPAENCSVK